MPELTDLTGIAFEDESGKEFEIVTADAHPNFETGRVVAKTPDYEVRGGGDDTMAMDARDMQQKFASGEFEVVDGNGAF